MFYKNCISEWKVQVPVRDLIDATELKITYHKQRLEYWTTKAEDMKERLKKEGITFYEKDAMYTNVRNSATGAMVDVGLSVNPEFRSQLNDYLNKVAEHRERIDYFEPVLAFLRRSNPHTSLECDVETIKEFDLVKPVAEFATA